MDPGATNLLDPESRRREWLRTTPWYRRALARVGLQGKLTICFMFLLAITIAGSCWLFVTRSRAALSGIMGEQTVQLSSTLALAARGSFAPGQVDQLNSMAQDLLKSRNMLFIVFADSDGRIISMVSRDPDFHAEQASKLIDLSKPRDLMQVRSGELPVIGEYLQVTAPVLAARQPDGHPGDTGLLGYVTVGVSPAREQAQLERVSYLVVVVGAVVLLLSLPIVTGLVYRIFHPIRELVRATEKIAAGDYDTYVAVHRPDAIGTLARSFNDMTVRVRQQQEQLEEANHGLEEKVSQRTAELESANTRLSSEIKEKEDFLRAVSHDLNAPLRNISGMATMLLMKHKAKFDDDIIHRLERIQQNVQVETDLIGELLELSRIKTRRLKMEAVEIHALVNDLAGMFENDLRSRGIALSIDGRLPVLWCEKLRLRQIFQNLIDNAIKYMGDGATKEIHVSCGPAEQGVQFTIRDTGLGMDPEDQSRLFTIFRRGKSSATQNVAGKGIGLATVKSIIETHEGRIWVESEVGKGTAFHFTIGRKFVPELGGGRAAVEQEASEAESQAA